MLDRGCWITWYDLPDEGRNDHLSWLHETYIPARLKTPGVLWGASYASEDKVVHPGAKGRLSHTDGAGVPAGDRFILVFGGETAHAFANPTPAEFHASLTDEYRKMLSMRVGERSNILTEEGRANGPEASERADDLTSAPCIQVGSFNCDYTEEDELAAWYAQWRLPSMEKLPGCIGVKKYASVAGWAKHVIFYEWTSVQARNNVFVNHEADNPKMEDWTDKVVRKLNHAPGSPNLAHRIWPEVKY